MVAGVVHAAVVAPHYGVGSFDDDASYILSAKAILAGHGLSGHLASGAVVSGAYPPGYPLLLVPLLWLWPHTYLPLRLLSLLCFAALFPLTWRFLQRCGVSEGLRIGVLVLMAANPVLATYATMVMAEMPFLVVTVLTMLAAERWSRQRQVLSWTGVGVLIGSTAMVWLKEAGIGLVIGMVVWLLLRRQAPKALAVAATTVALLSPVVIARAVAGVPLAGSRYSQELGGYYSGGLLGRVVHVLPRGLWHWLSTALPASVVPSGAPLPQGGAWTTFFHVFAWQVSLLCAVGFVAWTVRRRDIVALAVAFYVAMTLLWPYINERRVVLVLPFILAWYVIGAATAGRAIIGFVRSRRWLAPPAWPAALAVVAAGAVALPLALQVPRDYLFGTHQSSSKPAGSRYMAVLAAVGSPSDVVETDYESTVGLLSGHRSANSAFVATLTSCNANAASAAIDADHAGFLLLGNLNKPGTLDSPCLQGLANRSDWAVRLLATSRDGASVYELIGPGTGHPDSRDLISTASVSGPAPVTGGPDPSQPGLLQPWSTTAEQGSATLEWDWGQPVPVVQVSVGELSAAGGAVGSVTAQIRSADGQWVTVAGSRGGVGDAPGSAPYLLAALPSATEATALRLVVDANALVSVNDVHVIARTGGEDQ
jgi:hypothetical protein